ncbi:MAG: family 2 glycosyl transferase [Verrucomicrobia bacterium]|nr:family 2 glycosyl transferase [Verrucomicrobiota bacterium]
MDISVVIPTHRPDRTHLRRTLAGLRAQTLAPSRWETVLVDNASAPPVDLSAVQDIAPENIRVSREPALGLTAARRRGFEEARAEIVVMVDDDNVLAPDYLAAVVGLFAAHPRIGALGGRSLPEFETVPPAWVREFDGLVACRDLGMAVKISSGLRPHGEERKIYPAFAPIGAGMALRREAVQPWLDAPRDGRPTDRRGADLTSGGDNDIVLAIMESGWEVGYFPALSLIHLIPTARVQADYLARLNRGIARSWVQVLARHDACPWGPIAAPTVPLRKLKAWFAHRPWSHPAARIRWQGACGHFEGLAALPR